MAKVTIRPGVKIGTFAKASSGGRILADGVKIIGGSIGRIADAETGGKISMRGAQIEASFAEIARAQTGGEVNLSRAVIVETTARLAASDVTAVASAILPSLNGTVTLDELAKILRTIAEERDPAAVEARLKADGAWKIVERVGGVASIVQLVASLFGVA